MLAADATTTGETFAREASGAIVGEGAIVDGRTAGKGRATSIAVRAEGRASMRSAAARNVPARAPARIAITSHRARNREAAISLSDVA